ncbi:MAG: hypothetical protein ACKVS7_17210 [Gemmatimonadaceae bacterium]
MTALVVGSAVPRPAVAQDAWNDVRTTALIRAAIDRRAVQLADTGLADYTAQAHGYLTFLAQLGEGFRLPPVVVKSDELMLEVYWGAPDRSKQRIIGRRDTLLLPTDISYHRDHLGVVQNNFPAIIRLGDGDEVQDVPHPLSGAGLATYDYRIVDSLTIRTSDRTLDVVMVSVRPKDDSQPAAVGAVYLDRATASVVRMTFSFTRAALKDRQLEDVSVILENGLVDGRFWLPRRQEIEIRRSATWMDFPARGIIRGRWEICCAKVNVGTPKVLFQGAEIVEVPRAQQRAYPFEGTILGGLPEEVRALDAEEVRRVQEEARALVRASALARARNTVPSARSLSDLARVNRVEGLALGAGMTQTWGGGFATTIAGRYGTADFRLKGRGALRWVSERGLQVVLEGRDDFSEVGDAAEASGLRNSIAAQEFGTDLTDPYGARGGELRLEWPRGETSRWVFRAARERHEPLRVRALPSNGTYEPTLAVPHGAMSQIGAEWSRGPTADPARAQWQRTVRVSGSRFSPLAGVSSVDAIRASFDVEGKLPVAGGRWVVRTIAAGVSAGDDVPAQLGVYFGGPVTGPGYAFHTLTGRLGLSQRLEFQRPVGSVTLDFGRFGRVPTAVVLAPYVHGVWLRDVESGRPFSGAIGVSLISLFELLRVDVARGVSGGGWMFGVDVTRDLWRVF